MVSSALNLSVEELLEVLRRLRREYADDLEYLNLRSELPADWPI